MSHLQVDHFFLCKVNRKISNAVVIVIVIVTYNIFNYVVDYSLLHNTNINTDKHVFYKEWTHIHQRSLLTK
jgi:hypothetical protein